MSEYQPDATELRHFQYNLVVGRLRERLNTQQPATLSLSGFRAAAVAVVLLDIGGLTHVILTKRSTKLRAHSGQVSLPGGSCDPEDGSPAATAARESHEEIGLEPDSLEFLGALDDQPTPSGFIITPCIATISAIPQYRLSVDEVTEVFEAPLSVFSEPGRAEPRGERRVGDLCYPLRAYRYRQFEITGATAYILETVCQLVVESS